MQYLAVKDLIVYIPDLSSVKISGKKIVFSIKDISSIRYESVEFESDKLAQESFDEAKKALTKK